MGKEVPGDLGSDAFAALNGNWESFGKGLAQMVAKLYTDDKLDEAGQRALLKSLHQKIHTIDKALADPRYASLYESLTSVRGHLLRRVDVADAILDTLNLKPQDVKAAKVKAAQADVLEALAALTADLEKVPGGSAWLPYVRAGEIKAALSAGKSDGVVSAVEKKLNSGSSLKDTRQRNFLARPAFRNLSQAIARLHHAEDMNVAAPDEQALRAKLTALVGAIEGYEDEGTSSAAHKVRDALAAAEKAAMDEGDRLDRGVRPHYMNYNLQLVASEEMLNKILGDRQTMNGPVTDFILGANVSGNETTTTTATVDLQPSNDAALIDLVINGVTQSNTVGVTSEASIYTYGYHRFGAIKSVRYDGDSITTSPARMTYVQPSNQTTGASTRYSGMLLFGGIADSIAVREAEARRGQSEAIAAQRIESRVLPEFDQKADEMIRDTNNRLQNDLKKRLDKAGVLPASVRVRTNDSWLRFSAQIEGPGELAGDVTNNQGDTAAGLVVHLHETLLNNAVGHMKLAGQTLTDAQVKAELERYFSLLAGRAIKLGDGKKPAAPEDKTSKLVFDQHDPIRFTIDNGVINLVIRAGIKQEGKEDIPTQIITVPLKLSVKGKQVMVDRGNVQVAAGAETADRATQVVRAGVMKKKLETVIQPMSLDGILHVDRPGKSEVNLQVANLRAENGWLTIWAN